MSTNERASRRFRFRPHQRIRERAEYEAVFRHGARVQDERMTLWLLASEDAKSATRLGIVVSRRHGSAVRRNRLKRTVREAFRRFVLRLPAACDIVCQPRIGAALSFADACESLVVLSEKALRRLRRGRPNDFHAP